MNALWRIEGAQRTFRRAGREIHALTRTTWSMEAGAFAAIHGPSGSGKTTLLSLMAGLDVATVGVVSFEGRDLAKLSGAERTRVRRRLGLVFQSSPMIARLPLWENVAYPLVPAGVPAAEREQRARRALARFGLEDRSDARPLELSGGERRRAGLARAAIGEPVAILADEPTADLDDEAAQSVIEWLRELHDAGTTIVVATHDARVRAKATHTIELPARSPLD